MQTSILERLNAGLCDAVIESGERRMENGHHSLLSTLHSQSILEYLNHSNLFVIPLDDEGRWFRYHHLFEDLLKARLRQSLPAEAIAALHQRAAAWYEQAGMAPDAIEHTLAARDYSRALKLIEKIALPMILQAYVRTVDGWLQAIPQEYLEQSPRINMAFAWINLLRGTFAQAGPHLERLVTMFSSPEADNTDASLQGEWLAIQSKLLLVQGRPAESRDLASRALQILPQEDTHVRSMVHANLAMAYQQMLDYDHAAEMFQSIVRDAQATKFRLGAGHFWAGAMMLLQGRLIFTYEIATDGINRLEGSGGHL
jgi:LuxR family maltose regulon positive regulatory protein